ncbi:MAG: hypothetical protein GVY33_10755 [Alphaproteobacteria bacterium]|jgi:hypothetical protein|nr:hypothetical protein [Alphaproteobacteria bacterium]
MSAPARHRRLAALPGVVALSLVLAAPAAAQEPLDLQTETPDEGFQLAVELARKSVTTVQPDPEVVNELRSAYARDPGLLIESTSVVAEFFATVAAANDYWREE